MAAVPMYQKYLCECRAYVSERVGYVYIDVESDHSHCLLEFNKEQYENGSKLCLLLQKAEIGQIKSIEIFPCYGEFMLENGFMTYDGGLFYECNNLEAVTQYVGYMNNYNGFNVKYYKDSTLVKTDFFQLRNIISISGMEDYDAIEIECVHKENCVPDEPSAEGQDVWW